MTDKVEELRAKLKAAWLKPAPVSAPAPVVSTPTPAAPVVTTPAPPPTPAAVDQFPVSPLPAPVQSIVTYAAEQLAPILAPAEYTPAETVPESDSSVDWKIPAIIGLVAILLLSRGK